MAAGITDLIFVTGRNKRAIEDHFDSAPELESDLESKGKHELLAMVRGILPAHVNCLYIRQSAPLGLGHAVLSAAPAVGDEPFAVLLADDLIDADTPAMKQLVDIAVAQNASVLGCRTCRAKTRASTASSPPVMAKAMAAPNASPTSLKSPIPTPPLDPCGGGTLRAGSRHLRSPAFDQDGRRQ